MWIVESICCTLSVKRPRRKLLSLKFSREQILGRQKNHPSENTKPYCSRGGGKYERTKILSPKEGWRIVPGLFLLQDACLTRSVHVLLCVRDEILICFSQMCGQLFVTGFLSGCSCAGVGLREWSGRKCGAGWALEGEDSYDSFKSINNYN